MRKQYGYTRTGYPRLLTVTGSSKSECILLMSERIRNMPPVFTESVDYSTTVNDLCKNHLAYTLHQKDMIKPTAADRRECTIRNQIEPSQIGYMQIGAVRPRDITDFVNELINTDKYSVSTIEKAFHVISSAYDWAVSREMLSHNPCQAVRAPIRARLNALSAKSDVEQDVIILSDEEEAVIRNAAFMREEDGSYKYPIGLYVLFLLETGIRIGELCALRWGDIHEQAEGTVIKIKKTRHYATVRDKDGITGFSVQEGISKNAHARVIMLSNQAVEVLQIIRERSIKTEDDDYFYLNRRKLPTNPSNLGYMLNKYYAKIGLDGITGAHILRRTFATKMFRQGAAVKEIAAYIGDLESTTTKYYIAIRRVMKAGDDYISFVPHPMEGDKK